MLEIIAAALVGAFLSALAVKASADKRVTEAEREVIRIAGVANLKEAYQDKAVKLERQLRSACNELDHERDKTARLQESLNNACRQIEQYQLAEQVIKAPVVKEGRRVRPGKAARAAARKRRTQPSHAVDAASYQIPAHHGFNTPLIVADECEPARHSRCDAVHMTSISSDSSTSSSSSSYDSSSSSYDSSSSSSGSSSSSSCD